MGSVSSLRILLIVVGLFLILIPEPATTATGLLIVAGASVFEV